MNHTLRKQRTLSTLVLYLIVSLLFTVSVKLHVHPGDASHHAPHGSAVAISTIDLQTLAQQNLLAEIEVTLDKFLNKLSQNIVFDLAFTSTPLLLLKSFRFTVTLYQEASSSIVPLPFAGTPPLRAPPL